MDIQSKIDECKTYLNNTDWADSKLRDLELEAEAKGASQEEIKELRVEHYETYKDLYEQRKECRKFIDEHQL